MSNVKQTDSIICSPIFLRVYGIAFVFNADPLAGDVPSSQVGTLPIQILPLVSTPWSGIVSS